ncbi:MAG TPA: hypothetical protein VFP37_01660 [Steroidobacteraceae bacterium]|nr:hypothetical protein [Steroidobacteraceae bacterium]
MKIRNIMALALALTFSTSVLGAERKAPKDIDVAKLTQETQQASYASGVHIAWWIPQEYWEASLAHDANVTEEGRKRFLATLDHYSMLAVVQAEVGIMGNFSYYDRDVVLKGLRVELSNGKEWSPLEPLNEVPKDVAPLIRVLTPILESAMGPLGQNMNFFVLQDRKKGKRLVSPDQPGGLRITLTDRQGTTLEPFLIEFPLDSLFVPRRCPNGKPAHISWSVCPWDGSKLPE